MSLKRASKGPVRTALVDAEIVAYHACEDLLVEERVGDEWTYTLSERAVRERFGDRVAQHAREAGCGRAVLAVGSAGYWRSRIYPEYKAGRAARRKPLGYRALLEWASGRWETVSGAWLEGDDVLGILHTDPARGETVVVSSDKDLATVPGLRYNPSAPEAGVVEVTEAEADAAHLTLALAGDRADGYPGAPGVGEVTARRELAAAGPDPAAMWATVVRLFGGDEGAALVQARLARVLRHGDYRWDTGEVRMWTPAADGNSRNCQAAPSAARSGRYTPAPSARRSTSGSTRPAAASSRRTRSGRRTST